MSNATCRVCGSTNIIECLSLNNAPSNVQHLLAQDELCSDRPINLRVYQCNECTLVQLPESLSEDYYDDYLMTTSHSQQMQEFQSEQAVDFINRFGLRGKRVVDVGCGDGAFLGHLKAAGAIPYGIEPSVKFRQLAIDKGFDVAAGYVGRENVIPGGPYDGFVTRQVLEHIPDPNDFIQGIRQSITPSAVGLVEVPSLEQAIEFGRFFDFFPDHLNYFSALTLRSTLERNGLEVLEITRGMFGEYNIAIVKNTTNLPILSLQNAATKLTDELRAYFTKAKTDGKRVAVWGAGGKGLTTMAVAEVSGVAYVVDSDPHKHGRYTPVCHIPVVPPETLLSDPVDAIILTALAYKQEILQQLRDDLHFGGEVVALGDGLEHIE